MSVFAAKIRGLEERVERIKTELAEWRESYEALRDVVIEELNPRDGEEAEEFLLIEAVKAAAGFITIQPCMCIAEEEGMSCHRCMVLGQLRGVRVDR